MLEKPQDGSNGSTASGLLNRLISLLVGKQTDRNDDAKHDASNLGRQICVHIISTDEQRSQSAPPIRTTAYLTVGKDVTTEIVAQFCDPVTGDLYAVLQPQEVVTPMSLNYISRKSWKQQARRP